MSYTLTPEQQDILTTAIEIFNRQDLNSPILKIDSVAGSSKTFTSLKISNTIGVPHQRYITYLNKLAREAEEVFSKKNVECSTTHALAREIIVKNGLKINGDTGKSYSIVKSFTYRDIPYKISYEDKLLLISYINQFYLSKYITVKEFGEIYNIENHYIELIEDYFDRVQNHKGACTHNFYLKVFQILLATGYISYDIPFSILYLDEAGDCSEVSLDIFMNIPAYLKVLTGDKFQNIYSFNHTINAFKALKHMGITKTLSTSFRCSKEIADLVESFCQRHLDEDFVFRGVDHPSHTIHTEAIISRTNSGLIEYMIKLTASDIPFSLTRSPKEIFADMLTLMNLKPGVKIHDPALKFIQSDVDDYFSSPTTQRKFKTCLSYINELYAEEEPTIKIAAKTIFTYGASTIYEAYKYAKKCDESHIQHPLILTTGHSSKGLTFDRVTIADDFNLDDILEMHPSERQPSDTEEIRLYYVTCTRARLELVNAKYLHR